MSLKDNETYILIGKTDQDQGRQCIFSVSDTRLVVIDQLPNEDISTYIFDNETHTATKNYQDLPQSDQVLKRLRREFETCNKKICTYISKI